MSCRKFQLPAFVEKGRWWNDSRKNCQGLRFSRNYQYVQTKQRLENKNHKHQTQTSQPENFHQISKMQTKFYNSDVELLFLDLQSKAKEDQGLLLEN